MEVLRTCKCGVTATKDTAEEVFLKDKRKPHGIGYTCRDCVNMKTKLKRRALKYKAVIYLGGVCERCGIIGTKDNTPIFDFHHLDPNEKEFTIGSNGTVTFSNIQEELDKCILLCSNCHRMEHKND